MYCSLLASSRDSRSGNTPRADKRFALALRIAAFVTTLAHWNAGICAPQSIRFADAFGSGMVLPHGEPVAMQGHADPNQPLTLEIGRNTYRMRSDAQGHWQVQVPALRAGGPYTFVLRNEAGATATLTDVLAGELWLCSGQSNMEFSAAMSTDQPAEIMQGHPAIRLLNVAHQTALSPQSDFADKPVWQLATTETVRRFSAVCYFFARRKLAEEGMPIGIINASWGGSAIEPWIGEKTLAALPDYREQIETLRLFRSAPRKAELRFAEDWVNWWQTSSKSGLVWQRGVLDASNEWQDAPLKDWRTYPDPSLRTFTGNLWFSAQFELSESQSRKAAHFVLGKIDEVDTTWLNGHFVGNTFGYGTRREYRLEPGLLKAGTNQFTVFVTNTYDAGGMTGPESDVGIRFEDGEFVPLGNRWKYRVVPKEIGYPPRAPWESVAGTSGMFNAMIAPLRPLAPSGVIWYQGESNTDKPARYGQLLASLVADWRTYFRRDLSFIVVQLPAYGPIQVAPAESGWAALRQAQQQVAMKDARTGLVVTHDLGNDADIHPRRKYAVAERTLRVAQALHGSGVQDGVIPHVTALDASSIQLEFWPPLSGDTDKTQVAGFSICGAQAGSCVAVNAAQQGNRITVARSALPAASRLRYCWSDGGICSLHSLNGLPVSSFELPLITAP